MRKVLLAFGACLSFAAPSLAGPAVTFAPALMHRAPSVHSHIVQEIPANAQIDLQTCAAGWCYASWRNLFGYIPAASVAGEPPPLVARPPVVVAPSVVVGPTWGWGGPYIGFGWGRW